MPNPREAIFDVLRAKRERKAADEKRAADWAKYEAENQRINAGSPFRFLRRVK